MKANFLIVAVAASLSAFAAPVWADGEKTVDIKRAALADAHLAIYARHNPQRDYQREYFAEAWKTFQDERIGQRLIKIICSRLPEEKLATATSKFQELKTALEPINVQALLNADEVVVVQVFEGMFNQTLAAARLNSTAAADCERGAVQAFELVARWTDGKATVKSSRVKNAAVTTLELPKESPFQPAFARLNDIVLISTNVGLLRHSVEQLQDDSAKSKFDDPRLKEALAHLPKPEDALVFFDGRRLFQSLGGIGDSIRSQSKNDADAARVARLIDRVVDETAILDYEVTVEYTEPGQNHTAAFGKLADGFDGKLLGRALSQAKPFDNWQSWVRKDATAYSLSPGVSLHVLYDGIVKLVREEFPESQYGFDKFAELQERVGVNLDRDILQSFSGESVSVTVPVKTADGSTRQESVTALKCQNPDKIRELLARAVDGLNSIPAVQMQQLKLEDCNDLKGFQKLHAAIFQMVGAQPVIGFRDGWMILASNQEAAEKLLAVREGKAESIDGAAIFAKLGIDPKGTVYRVSYRDIGAGVRQAADTIDKIGAMAPMFLSMAARNAKPEDLKLVQEVIGLLPSVAKVVRKFDFFGHNLSVTRQGPSPGTYLRESVTEVRVPKGM
jgi:hypothetical protein